MLLTHASHDHTQEEESNLMKDSLVAFSEVKLSKNIRITN